MRRLRKELACMTIVFDAVTIENNESGRSSMIGRKVCKRVTDSYHRACRRMEMRSKSQPDLEVATAVKYSRIPWRHRH